MLVSHSTIAFCSVVNSYQMMERKSACFIRYGNVILGMGTGLTVLSVGVGAVV